MKKKIAALLMAVAMTAQFTVQLAATSQPPESASPSPAEETPSKGFWDTTTGTEDKPCWHDCTHQDTKIENAQEPTCGLGYTGDIVCQLCGCKQYGDDIPAKTTEHTLDTKWHSDNKYHFQWCTVCGERLYEVEHDFSATADDRTPICSECGAKDMGDGHTHVYDRKMSTKEYLSNPATCAEPAYYYYSCVCGAKGSETYQDGDKDFNKHIDIVSDVDVPATCSAEGICNRFCSACGTIIEKNVPIPALNHVFDEAWTFNDTHHWHDCAYVNDGCPLKESERDGYAPHKFDIPAVLVPATETKSGQGCWKCECGQYFETFTIPPTNHQHQATRHESKPATCTVAGNKEYWTCSQSGCEDKRYADEACQIPLSEEAIVIPALGHKWAKEWTINDTFHWHNCENPGCPVTVTSEKEGFGTHQYNISVVLTPATESAPGKGRWECKCSDWVETFEISPLTPSSSSTDDDKEDEEETSAATNATISGSQVEEELSESKGDKVTISVEDGGKVAKKAFTELAETDKTLVLKGDGYSWSIKGSDITKPLATAYFKIGVRDTSPYDRKIDKLVDQEEHQVIHTEHHGELPGKVTLRLKVENALRRGLCYLYYYNPTTGQAEAVASGLKADSLGYVEIAFSEHLSTYFLTDKPLEGAVNSISATGGKVNPGTGAGPLWGLNCR